MKKCLFLSKEIVRLELDGLEEDFEERKFWNGPKGGPQYACHVVPPLVLTKNSKIEILVFKMKKCLFLSKEIVSIRIGWFGGRFWGKKILKWTKGGTTVSMHVMWSPLWFWRKNSKIEILVYKMKKCLFLSKEIVSIRIGWFGGRFWGKKILKWTKGGTTVCMSCGPPFGFDEKIQKLKYLFLRWKNACIRCKHIITIIFWRCLFFILHQYM